MKFTKEEKLLGKNIIKTLKIGTKVLQYKNQKAVSMLNTHALIKILLNTVKIASIIKNSNTNNMLISRIKERRQINDTGYF